MMSMNPIITLPDGYFLSFIQASDAGALVEYLNDKEIYNTTLTIPYPYKKEHADSWIGRKLAYREKFGTDFTFAIRDESGKLIGIVAADNYEPGKSHYTEIGYWLARPYWGRGIITGAVRAFIRYLFLETELKRVTAHIFSHNTASVRVVEKSGFVREGLLRKHYCKDGVYYDGFLYGLLKEEMEL
jgi:[ribosomal protein S5]-alanine N-acetyltransferase